MLWSLAVRMMSRLRGAAPETPPLPAAAGKRQRAAIAIVEGGRILLIHRIKPGKDYYVLPGGGIKRRETAAIACVRETREETGLNVHLGGTLCVLDARTGSSMCSWRAAMPGSCAWADRNWPRWGRTINTGWNGWTASNCSGSSSSPKACCRIAWRCWNMPPAVEAGVFIDGWVI